MHKLIALTPELVKALNTAELPSYAQQIVSTKQAKLRDSIDDCIWCFKVIQSSTNIFEALETIQGLDDDFINQIIYKIKSKYDIYKLEKSDFLFVFNELAFQNVFKMRLEIDRIYFDFMDSIISTHAT
ncbi:MAG: hypothetical protein H7196_01190 [candidate division SR1 bacterium]|nr:hypothetical protein [candidate division SR1 bacterium]